MKHVKLFEQFIAEKSHRGRAWSGKITNIDNLMSWMYDKDILTNAEKNEKDKKFREYYRWYNDGDYPTGQNGNSDSEVEEYLENSIEEFIKKVLSKYSGKYNRKDFQLDTILGDLKTLQNVAGGYQQEDGVRGEPDPYGLLNYWGTKINTNNSEFEKLLSELRPIYDAVKKAAMDIVNKELKSGIFKDKASYSVPGENTSLSFQRKSLKDSGVWTADAEKKYMKMKDIMTKMSDIISNVIEATEKLKKEIGS